MGGSRNLSVAKYYIEIQKEYIIDTFRSKIYSSLKDRNYWRKVANYKKEKIESISIRNRLKSIFNDSDKFDEFQSKIFDANGKPIYEMTRTDLDNYYSIGCEFSYKGEIFYLAEVLSGELRLKNVLTDKIINVPKNLAIRIV